LLGWPKKKISPGPEPALGGPACVVKRNTHLISNLCFEYLSLGSTFDKITSENWIISVKNGVSKKLPCFSVHIL
jgi:hypothetical protein